MLTERTTTLFVSIFYFQKCQTRDYNKLTDKVQPAQNQAFSSSPSALSSSSS